MAEFAKNVSIMCFHDEQRQGAKVAVNFAARVSTRRC
jgi:hypothetical protein